jgi:hypothetical protein
MKKKPQTNDALRQWARGISFTIAMGRRQVYTLIALHLSQDKPSEGMMFGDRHRHLAHFVTSMHCLVDRGLVVAHVWHDETLRRKSHARGAGVTYGQLYRVTRAGELIVELLREAGIYEEVRAELEAADRPRVRIA